MAYPYDSRVAAPINRLSPLAQQAADEFRQGSQMIIRAYQALTLIKQEALANVPKGHQVMHGRPMEADKFREVYETARDLQEMLDKHQPFNVKGLVELFDELASETKARWGE